MTRQTPPDPPVADDPYTVDRVRQGDIVLRRSWQKFVFFGGMIGAIALGLIVAFLAGR